MSDDWRMLTLIGKDGPGIVAGVTSALAGSGVSLGETSMLRLGGNFTIMMMISGEADDESLRAMLEPVVATYGMRLHIDHIDARLHEHLVPNVQVTVSGADRVGIVAQVTNALAEGGFNILDLDSDVAGSSDDPVYILLITGIANETVEQVEQRLEPLRQSGVSVNVSAIETYIG